MSLWPGLLRLAVLELGLTPEAFWRLSLAEWRALTAIPEHDLALSRSRFDVLCSLYPDEVP
jgi:uncharacterized phage protein (TIGR02216 family)